MSWLGFRYDTGEGLLGGLEYSWLHLSEQIACLRRWYWGCSFRAFLPGCGGYSTYKSNRYHDAHHAGVARRLFDKVKNFANSLNNPRLEGFTLKFFNDVGELSHLREERCSINVLPRQGMMLLLSPADTKLWDDRIKLGLPAALGGLFVIKAHRELREFLRLPW